MNKKSYTVMELEAIKKLCKSVNLIANLPTDLIADTNVATNTTYSSYKIDAEMSALENDIQSYVDTALAGLNKLTKEVIDDKALVVKENVLYLYKDPTDMNNDYMQMMLINGVAVELGSTTCDFSSVYSKDEIDDKFSLKIDLDVLTTSFNNLVTSVENKIDKDKIVTILDDTVTDEQVPSAKAVYEELDKKIEGDNVVKKDDIVTVLDDTVTDEQVPSAKVVYDELNTKANDDEVVKKTDIVTTIDKTSTDSEIPTSKAVYDSTKYSSISLECPIDKSPLEFVVENMKDNTILYFNSWGNSSGATPDAWASYIGIRHKDHSNLFLIVISAFGDSRVNTYRNNVWSGWRRICTTSARVADVGKTVITLNTMSNITFGNISGFYLVSNGICTVDITFNCTTTAPILWTTAYNSLPIPKYLFHASAPASDHDTAPLLINVKTDGTMEWYIGSTVTVNRTYYVHFSYPVAE